MCKLILQEITHSAGKGLIWYCERRLSVEFIINLLWRFLRTIWPLPNYNITVRYLRNLRKWNFPSFLSNSEPVESWYLFNYVIIIGQSGEALLYCGKTASKFTICYLKFLQCTPAIYSEQSFLIILLVFFKFILFEYNILRSSFNLFLLFFFMNNFFRVVLNCYFPGTASL